MKRHCFPAACESHFPLEQPEYYLVGRFDGCGSTHGIGCDFSTFAKDCWKIADFRCPGHCFFGYQLDLRHSNWMTSLEIKMIRPRKLTQTTMNTLSFLRCLLISGASRLFHLLDQSIIHFFVCVQNINVLFYLNNNNNHISTLKIWYLVSDLKRRHIIMSYNYLSIFFCFHDISSSVVSCRIFFSNIFPVAF